jgi:MFS family permease
MALVTSALYGMFFLLTLYLQLVLGWSPLQTGLAYVPFGLGVLGGIAVASQVLPRVGVRPVLVSGMAMSAGGLALFTRLPIHLAYWTQLVPAMVLIAVGLGLAFVSITVAAVSEAKDADAGLASGMVTTAQQVGGALGLAVLVSIATSRASSLVGSGHSPAAAQLAGSHLAFAVGAGLLAAGAVLAAALIGRLKPVTLPTPTPLTQIEVEEFEPEALSA